jgi:hypothetical protein
MLKDNKRFYLLEVVNYSYQVHPIILIAVAIMKLDKVLS